jgi:hypothetical protein
MSTLPTQRFQDLSSDVYLDLMRRYPEVKAKTAPVCVFFLVDLLFLLSFEGGK